MKNFTRILCPILIVCGLASCAQISAYVAKYKEDAQKEEVDFSPDKDSGLESPCKLGLNKALKVFDKDMPLLGSDLDIVVNLLSQYQSCEVVRRDDRIAEVLLKMLQRVQALEAEVSELKAKAVGSNP